MKTMLKKLFEDAELKYMLKRVGRLSLGLGLLLISTGCAYMDLYGQATYSLLLCCLVAPEIWDWR